MNTAQATINVRMNAALKERGDGVLREHGLSTSQAIRALWRQLAQTREVPAQSKSVAPRPSGGASARRWRGCPAA